MCIRKIFLQVAAILFFNTALAQNNIQGDKLLEIIGKPLTDPMFQQLKQQESFLSDAWNRDFSIYVASYNDIIERIEVENGKLKLNSTDSRYGYYNKPLPLQLSWNMDANSFAAKLGKPVAIGQSMNYKDYKYKDWGIKIFFENDKPVSIDYKKEDAGKKSVPLNSNLNKPVASNTAAASKDNWIVKLDAAANAQVNWPAIKRLVLVTKNLKPLATQDSVDYIGQVYYATPYQTEGFTRSAVKRIKKNNQWFYESFYKTGADSETVRKIFFALYDALKKTIKDNTGEDFILASVAKKPISQTPMNWIAQWSLYHNYKTLPAGLPEIKIALMLSAMKNYFKEGGIDYTLKIFIYDGELNYDFFTWDKPL